MLKYPVLRDYLKKPLVHLILIAALGLIVYSNTFNVPFQWDDKKFITENPFIKDPNLFLNSPKDESEAYTLFRRRPVGYLTYAINYKLHRLDVTGYHIANISIHLMNSVLVYLLITLTFRTPFLNDFRLIKHPRYISLFAALLFVSHPIQTEAVTYILGRTQILMSCFYLCSIVLYIRWRGSQAPFNKRHAMLYLFSLLSAVLAMKTKENAFTLPFAIALYEIFFFNGILRKRILYLVPFFLALPVIPLLFIHGDVAQHDTAWEYATAPDSSRWDYLVTQFRVIVTYVRLLFLPINQNFDYDYLEFNSFFNPQVFLSFLFLSGIFIAAVYLYYRSRKEPELRIISFGVFWFFLALSVESSIFPIPMIICEYRAYLPSVGIFAAFSAAYALLSSKRENFMPIFFAAVFLIITTLAVTTYLRNSLWKDEITLWTDTAKKSPIKERPYNNLGIAYAERSDFTNAILNYKKALSLDPGSVETYVNLGNVYSESGNLDEAVIMYRKAIAIDRENPGIYYNLGVVYERAGDFVNALKQYQEALKLDLSYEYPAQRISELMSTP